jgi:hypothetical protein
MLHRQKMSAYVFAFGDSREMADQLAPQPCVSSWNNSPATLVRGYFERWALMGMRRSCDMLVRCLLNNSDIFIFAKGRFPGSLDLSQNLLSFGSPDVTLGIEVMLGEVLHNSVNQLAHAAEAAGQDRLLAQVSEEAFD